VFDRSERRGIRNSRLFSAAFAFRPRRRRRRASLPDAHPNRFVRCVNDRTCSYVYRACSVIIASCALEVDEASRVTWRSFLCCTRLAVQSIAMRFVALGCADPRVDRCWPAPICRRLHSGFQIRIPPPAADALAESSFVDQLPSPSPSHRHVGDTTESTHRVRLHTKRTLQRTHARGSRPLVVRWSWMVGRCLASSREGD
jgi:hypothetical protein